MLSLATCLDFDGHVTMKSPLEAQTAIIPDSEKAIQDASALPAVASMEPPTRAASNILRFQILTWSGIVGGAITIFGNLREFLNLADWARWLVTHWSELTHAIWATIFG